MRLLSEIKRENEVIVDFETEATLPYEYLCDMDCTTNPTDNIPRWLEYTLHRMLDAKFDNIDIFFNCAMLVATAEQIEDGKNKAFPDFIEIDLGYRIFGLITFAQVKDGE